MYQEGIFSLVIPETLKRFIEIRRNEFKPVREDSQLPFMQYLPGRFLLKESNMR